MNSFNSFVFDERKKLEYYISPLFPSEGMEFYTIPWWKSLYYQFILHNWYSLKAWWRAFSWHWLEYLV